MKRSHADVENLAAAFNEARIGGFRTVAGANETGLAVPPQKITFYAWLSENTAEDAAGAHVIAGADLGNAAPDGGTYARSAAGEETVTVPETLSGAVRAAVFPPAPVSSPR